MRGTDAHKLPERDQTHPPEASPPRVVIGVAAGGTTLTRFWGSLIRWLSGNVPYAFVLAEGNRIDLNRSMIIGRAKEMLPPTGEFDSEGPWLVMVDTDVVPTIPLDTVLETAYDDLQHGFDVSCSPIPKYDEQSHELRLLARVPQGAELPVAPSAPFEVAETSLGFAVLSARCVRQLRPLRRWTNFNQTTVDVFCEMGETSEDYDLCRRVRALSMRVCCDPRMEAFHIKGVPLRSLGPWSAEKGFLT